MNPMTTTLMTAACALDLYHCLDEAGIKVWIDGGWCVDALIGKQLRPHNDLDIALQWKDVPQLRDILTTQGYRQIREDSQWTFVLSDDKGHEIDIHAFVYDDQGNVVDGVLYPAQSLTGVGVIDGHSVRCISPQYMVEFLAPWIHKWPEKYVPAVFEICKKYGIDLPKEYTTHQQLKESIELLQSLFESDLLGVYLYGSALVGGLQKYSDIDVFVVTRCTITSEQKTKLMTRLLDISGVYMKSQKSPLEITIVEKTAINPWQYPPRCAFQYGEWLRDSFEQGTIEPSTTHEMPDLALIVTQILLKSQTLFGVDPEQLLAPVPYHDFMKAMLHDISRLATDLEHDTRNVLLTYARIWSTLATDEIRSKPAAADWVMHHLPQIYQSVMQRAKSICIGTEREHWDDIRALIEPCVKFMVDKIHAQSALIHFDDPNRSIKLAHA